MKICMIEGLKFPTDRTDFHRLNNLKKNNELFLNLNILKLRRKHLNTPHPSSNFQQKKTTSPDDSYRFYAP